MKALLFKELREVYGIALAALACYLALAVNLMGAKVFDWVPGIPAGTQEVPFTGAGFLVFYVFVSVGFAVALGFRQSAWESARGTYLFLLHRPIRRDVIFLTKLATGAGVFLLCASVPVLLYGAWAAVPGNHPSPFAWSMTEPVWRLALLMLLLYLGAFHSGVRPARWFGTRLLPLVGPAALLLLVYALPWYLGLALAVAACGLLVASICHVTRVRDYA